MRAFYDSKSRTIDDRGIKALFTDEAKYNAWLAVETALAKAQAAHGFIPREAAEEIAASAKIENLDFEEMGRIYEKVGHGFVPFLKVLVKACPPESGKYVHYGITTQNVQQTSQLYIMKQVHEKFLLLAGEILHNLAILAEENKDTVMAGRTHGRHATPITYGYKVSVWISELLAAVERMENLESRVFQVMMGGAVGTFSSMPEVGPQVQEHVAESLGMHSMDVPSRNINTHKLEYIMALQLLASVCHKMAEEVYQTSIEEIAEVAEGFKEGTIGSSTMPHKINPKLAKGIIANSQKLYSLSSVGLYSSVRPYEGDSSQYMLFDGIVEEALELSTEILLRAEELSRTLNVRKERMRENVNINKGLDNSEYVMMKIADKLGKDKAHSLVYDIAIKTAAYGEDFYTNLSQDAVLAENFAPEELQHMIDPGNYIGLAPELAEKMARKAEDKSAELLATYQTDKVQQPVE